jgi:hypothetical protein
MAYFDFSNVVRMTETAAYFIYDIKRRPACWFVNQQKRSGTKIRGPDIFNGNDIKQ